MKSHRNRDDSETAASKAHPSMGDSPENLGNLEHIAQPQAAQQVGESFLSDSALLPGSLADVCFFQEALLLSGVFVALSL